MNKPMMGPGGIVYPSGMGMRRVGARRPFKVQEGPFRAVVIETYVMGDPDEGVDPSDGAGPRVQQARVEADVILVRSGMQLRRVPVTPRNWGVNNAAPWVPRKTTRSISQNQPLNTSGRMNFRGEAQGEATSLADVDGDIVLVDFIENDIHFPIIRDVLPHPASKRPIIEGTGWDPGGPSGAERGTPHADEQYQRFAGFELRVNADGDVLLDTVGSTSDLVDEDPATGGGQIRFRVKDSERLIVEMDGTDVLEVWDDGGQMRIDLGTGAAERLVLGDTFRSFLNDWLTHVFVQHQHMAGTLVGASAVTGQTGAVAVATLPVVITPPPPLTYTGSSMPESHLSDLARTKQS